MYRNSTRGRKYASSSSSSSSLDGSRNHLAYSDDEMYHTILVEPTGRVYGERVKPSCKQQESKYQSSTRSDYHHPHAPYNSHSSRDTQYYQSSRQFEYRTGRPEAFASERGKPFGNSNNEMHTAGAKRHEYPRTSEHSQSNRSRHPPVSRSEYDRYKKPESSRATSDSHFSERSYTRTERERSPIRKTYHYSEYESTSRSKYTPAERGPRGARYPEQNTRQSYSPRKPESSNRSGTSYSSYSNRYNERNARPAQEYGHHSRYEYTRSRAPSNGTHGGNSYYAQSKSSGNSHRENHNHDHRDYTPKEPLCKTSKASVQDYYALLGISSKASADEIQKAVRKRRVEVHPDRLKKPGMSELEVKEINDLASLVGQAADVLQDPRLRRGYDLDRADSRR